MVNNPYLRELKSAGRKEVNTWRNRAEEFAKESDLTESEIEERLDEIEDKIVWGIENTDDFLERQDHTLIPLLGSLASLEGEWRERSNYGKRDEGNELEWRIAASYSTSIQHEVERVEYALKHK